MLPRSNMTMPTSFYDGNARDYFDRTVGVDTSSLYELFVSLTPGGGRILDAGCGSGRDSLAFLRMGYDVTAFDGSEALAKMASDLTGLPVVQMLFQEISFEEEFDGIWACASLLHVPKSEIHDVFRRFTRALKPGGHWYISFKYGEGELAADDRLFNNYTPRSLGELIAEFPQLAIDQVWSSPDLRLGREDENWLNAIVHKIPERA